MLTYFYPYDPVTSTVICVIVTMVFFLQLENIAMIIRSLWQKLKTHLNINLKPWNMDNGPNSINLLPVMAAGVWIIQDVVPVS